MERLMILLGRPNKSVAPTKYFFKVPQVGRFIPLISVIRRRVESPLEALFSISFFISKARNVKFNSKVFV